MNSEMIPKQASRMGGSVYRCTAQGHELEYGRLMAMHPRMRKLEMHEKQPGNTLAQTIWVYPEAWQALEARYPQNLMTTLCALLTALADEDTILVEGENARELRKLGVARGREVVGLAQAHKELQAEIADLRMREKVLEPFLKAMGSMVGGTGMQAGQAGQGQSGQAGQAQTGEQAPPEQPPRAVQPVLVDPNYEPSDQDVVQAAAARIPGAAAAGASVPAVHGIPRPVPSGR